MLKKGIYIICIGLLVSFMANGQSSPTRTFQRDDGGSGTYQVTADSASNIANDGASAASQHPLGLMPNPIIRKDTRYTYDDFIWRTIDTSILRFHEYNLVSKWEYPYSYLGIVGQNYQSLVFNPNRKLGYQTGFNSFEKYWYTADNTKYYNTKIPFTSIYYNLGADVENNANAVHSQNVSPFYNFAVDYRLTNAQGAFNDQKTLMHNLNINNWYNSKNHRYILLFAFIFNRLELEENGGLDIDNLYDKQNAGTARDLVPINLNGASNDIKNRALNLKQIFFLGKKDSVQVNDSTYLEIVQRKHAISYNFNYDNWNYTYEDQENNFDYYDNFYFDSTGTRDTSKYWTVTNTFRWENTPETLAADSSITIPRLRYFAAMDYGYTKFTNLDLQEKWHNLSFSGGLASNPLLNHKWQYGLRSKVMVSPKSAGDFEINAFLFWKINDMMHLRAEAESQRTSATQKETEFRSNHFVWNNNLDPVFDNRLSLIFRCDHGDIDGELTWHNVQRYIYLDENIDYQQAQNNINVLIFRASKGFDWKNFYLYNGIIAQYISDREKINLPKFYLKQSFHYKGGFAKGKLTAHLGVDITYYTKYLADAYNPAITDFYRQQTETLKFYPIMDAYFEIFIKRARIFFLMQHVNQGMFKQKGYYTAPDYGAQDRAIKVGVSWQFYD
ncbi:MAG: putative porin [Chitinophagales bacterium]